MDVTSYLLGKKAGGGSAPVLQDKEVEITENGETTITADSGYDGLRSVDVDTNVQPDLETKSITITENTTTTITPTSGKDGLSSVEITTDVQSGGGKFAFVSDGGFCFYFNTKSSLQTEIDNIANNVDTSTIQSTVFMFGSCSNLTSIDLSAFDLSNVTNMQGTFQYCSSLATVIMPQNPLNYASTYSNLFQACPNLTSVDLRCLVGSNSFSINMMFTGCTSLQHLDLRNMDFTKVSSYSNAFGNTDQNYVPANCEIIVKDATQKAWFTNNSDSNIRRLRNVKTVAEYEGS